MRDPLAGVASPISMGKPLATIMSSSHRRAVGLARGLLVAALLSRVEYVFPDYLNGAARYRVTLEYTDRRDADGVD